jgi:hypothetical protein
VKPVRKARPDLNLITNNLRLAQNYRILDQYIALSMKAGHLILRWDWTSPNKAEASCVECDLELTVDTELPHGHEADGSPILENYCE